MINPLFLEVGFIQIHWYSVILLLALFIGYKVSLFYILQDKKLKISRECWFDHCFYLVISSIIFARLYHCVANIEYYTQDLLSVFKVWEGGLAIHGAILGGVLYLVLNKKKISFFKSADILSLSLLVGQSIGRWGNFFNQELYGKPTSSFIGIPIDLEYRLEGYHMYEKFHPVFLYESLWLLLGFVILSKVSRKYLRYQGVIFAFYLIWG